MVFLEQSILRFGFYLKTSSSSGKDQEREFANETKLVYGHHRVCNRPYLHSREQRQRLEALLARGLLTRAQCDLKILNSLLSQSERLYCSRHKNKITVAP